MGNGQSHIIHHAALLSNNKYGQRVLSFHSFSYGQYGLVKVELEYRLMLGLEIGLGCRYWSTASGLTYLRCQYLTGKTSTSCLYCEHSAYNIIFIYINIKKT